ncbi:hypothetical protein Tco_1497558 [Tanacetum coccineum]
MLAHDEEIARKMQEEWEVEEEKNILAVEEAINAALIQEFDEVKARIKADRLLALRESGKKHADLKNRNFDDIQALYDRIKRNNDKFLTVDSTKDKRKKKEMNEKAKDHGRERLMKKVVKETLKEDDPTKVPAEHEVTEQGINKRESGHIKMIASKRPRPQPNDDSDIDNDDDELRLTLIIVPDEDKEVDYEILDKKYPIIEWKSEYLTTKPKFDESKGLEEVNLNMVVRSNGQKRYFSTLMRVLSVFDREDMNAIY